MDSLRNTDSARPLVAAPEAGGSSEKRIVLRRNVAAGCWTAQHFGTLAARVIAAFGTDTVAVPFSAEADALDVLGTIRILNPGVLVEVA